MGYQNSLAATHNYDSGAAVGSHRDFSRSMSTENWREAKLSGAPPAADEERETIRGNGTHVRGMNAWKFSQVVFILCYLRVKYFLYLFELNPVIMKRTF